MNVLRGSVGAGKGDDASAVAILLGAVPVRGQQNWKDGYKLANISYMGYESRWFKGVKGKLSKHQGEGLARTNTTTFPSHRELDMTSHTMSHEGQM